MDRHRLLLQDKGFEGYIHLGIITESSVWMGLLFGE